MSSHWIVKPVASPRFRDHYKCLLKHQLRLTVNLPALTPGTPIYVDGKQQGQTTSGVPLILQNSTANLNVGREAGAVTPNYLNGSLDEVKLYNYALSPDEVKVEYNQGKAMVLGSLSTDPDGITASNSAARAYCVPGDTTTCNPPVAHWTFDERTGTTANDITGNGNTGTLTNGPTWTTGKIGQALSFDGVDDVVRLGSSLPSSIYGTNARTISLWFFNQAATWDIGTSDELLQLNNSGTNGAALTMTAEDNGVSVAFVGHRIIFDKNNLSSNTWYQVTIVIPASATTDQVLGYINGVQKAQATENGSAQTINTASGGPADIGADNGGGSTFLGTIDDVRIYNYARTPAQIAWDYNRGGPIGLWKFDECTGNTAYDLSGQGNNGTISLAAGSQTTTGNCVTSDASAAWYNGAAGKYNSSLNFDGTDDVVTIAAAASLDLTDDLTIAAWVKQDAANGESMIFQHREDAVQSGAGYNFQMNRGGVCSACLSSAAIGGTRVDSTEGVLKKSVWQHLVVVRSGGVVTFYVDGVSAGGGSQGSITSAPNVHSYIGNDDTSASTMKGSMDDVRVYNYALTQAQIKTLYNENSAVRFGPLTGSP